MSSRAVFPVTRESFERVIPVVSLIVLALIAAQVAFQSVSAWISGAR